MNSQIADKQSVAPTDKVGKSHQAYAMEESRLNKAKENCLKNNMCDEFKNLGGDSRLSELENLVKTNQDVNYNEKKTGMDAGLENRFIKKHKKDRDNANPTAVGGVPKMNKGDISRKIMTNTEVYNESELPITTQSHGIVNISGIDDMKKLIKDVLPENCYKKRFFEPLNRFEITSNDSSNNVSIYGKNGLITINNSKETKSFNPNEITNISYNLRKMVVYELGTCFDVNKINEDISNIRYLIEYMDNKKIKI